MEIANIKQNSHIHTKKQHAAVTKIEFKWYIQDIYIDSYTVPFPDLIHK